MKVTRNTVDDVMFIITTMVCPCCGMALRMSPTNTRDKERLTKSTFKTVITKADESRITQA